MRFCEIDGSFEPGSEGRIVQTPQQGLAHRQLFARVVCGVCADHGCAAQLALQRKGIEQARAPHACGSAHLDGFARALGKLVRVAA